MPQSRYIHTQRDPEDQAYCHCSRLILLLRFEALTLLDSAPSTYPFHRVTTLLLSTHQQLLPPKCPLPSHDTSTYTTPRVPLHQNPIPLLQQWQTFGIAVDARPRITMPTAPFDARSANIPSAAPAPEGPLPASHPNDTLTLRTVQATISCVDIPTVVEVRV